LEPEEVDVRIPILVSIAVLIAGAAVTLEPAHASFPGSNGVIGYTSQDSAGWELFVMNQDGSGSTQLSFVGDNYEPAWSPDGTHLAFTWTHFSPEHIWVARADGSERTQLTFGNDHDRNPTWSPDGSSIAFDREDGLGGPSEIYAVPASGGSAVNLTNDPSRDWDPTWSPDGTTIAFISDRAPQGLYVMNADGTDQHLLAAGGYYPDWSPDGSHLVFTFNTIEPPAPPQLPAGSPPPPRPFSHLWLVDPDGSNLHQLTYRPGEQILPSWSPDGSQIAFQGPGSNNGFDVFVLDLATNESTQLTHTGVNGHPAWQPVPLPQPPPPPPPPPLPPPPPPPPSPPPPPPPPRSCVVPRVIGMRLIRARARIRRAGCSVGTIRRVRSRRPPGRVAAQTPAPGRRLSFRKPVRLAVSARGAR
jgi:hypothetical protein